MKQLHRSHPKHDPRRHRHTARLTPAQIDDRRTAIRLSHKLRILTSTEMLFEENTNSQWHLSKHLKSDHTPLRPGQRLRRHKNPTTAPRRLEPSRAERDILIALELLRREGQKLIELARERVAAALQASQRCVYRAFSVLQRIGVLHEQRSTPEGKRYMVNQQRLQQEIERRGIALI